MKWLQALKLSKEEPELFYAVGLYTYFVKGDVKKAQQLLEKTLAFKPDFCEATFLLCVILMSANQTIKPFTYLFQGVNEYENGNYVQAIEHFQNTT